MTTQSKLYTLKVMLRHWKLTRSITDAVDICKFLDENLDLGEQEGEE